MARAACLRDLKDPAGSGSTEGEALPRGCCAAASTAALGGSHAVGLFLRHDPEEIAECASP